MPTARNTRISLTYSGKNITEDITPYLTGFTFTDNSGDKADDIAVMLQDRDELWLSDWFPQKGDTLTASIIHDSGGRVQSLPCGSYSVDQIDYAAPPHVITIKAVSASVKSAASSERHTKAWENVNLSTIAGDVANSGGLRLFWDVSDDPFLERREQVKMSDLEYLRNLCDDYGLNVKVHDGKLIVYDEAEYSEKSSVAEITRDMNIITFRFSSKTSKIYAKSSIKHHHATKKENFSGSSSDDSTTGTGKTLNLRKRVDNAGDAQNVAKRKLAKANSREITGSITLMGDLRFMAGVNVTISGFGGFDGKYLIDRATHTVNGSGYVTSIELKAGSSAKKAAKKKKSRKKKLAKGSGETFYTGKNVYDGT